MKVEIIDNGFRIFLQNNYFNNINWEDKDEIIYRINDVFNLIEKNYHIHLKGLYRVKVYPNEVGVIIYTILLDNDTYSSNDYDLKIVVLLNKNFYLRTNDYSFVKDKNYFSYNDYCYINISDISNYLSYVEFGDLVLEDEIK